MRGSDESTLEKINVTLPTWSWMAYKGGIDYLEVPFSEVDWVDLEVCSPWGSGSKGVWHPPEGGITEIKATARDIFWNSLGPESKMIYDIPGATSEPDYPLMCVVVARVKGDSPYAQKMHFVLLVRFNDLKVLRMKGVRSCERIGVGYILGQSIELAKPGIRVFID